MVISALGYRLNCSKSTAKTLKQSQKKFFGQRAVGLNIWNYLPADTLFTKKILTEFEVDTATRYRLTTISPLTSCVTFDLLTFQRPLYVIFRTRFSLKRVVRSGSPPISALNYPLNENVLRFVTTLNISSRSSNEYCLLAVITRPPDGVLLAPSALAARRLRRLASLLEL